MDYLCHSTDLSFCPPSFPPNSSKHLLQTCMIFLKFIPHALHWSVSLNNTGQQFSAGVPHHTGAPQEFLNMKYLTS